MPDGWDGVAIAEYGALMQDAIAQVDDPRVTQALEVQLAEIEEGVLRAAATGVTEPSGFTTFLVLSVLEMAGDLESTVDRRLQQATTSGIPGTIVAIEATDIPFGEAYCTAVNSDIDIGTPSQTIEYLATAPTGEVVAIGGTAPTTDTAFPALVRSVALTLAAD